MKITIQSSILAIVFIFFVTSIFLTNAIAGNKFKIAEIDPQKTELNIYRSYKYKLFIVGMIHKTTDSFDCTPNRFIFYNYETDQFFQITAGNLLINSDFTNIFATKVHRLGAMNKKNELAWKLDAKRILKNLNTSSSILEKNKIEALDSSICWQQPVLYSAKGELLHELPLLLANFCDLQFCARINWQSSNIVRFWKQITPTKIQQLEYDLSTKTSRPIKTAENHKITNFDQTNAPRDEIVDTEKNQEGFHNLVGNKIKFFWGKNKNSKLVVGFEREDVNILAANKNIKAISDLLAINDLKRAFQQIRFGLWLAKEHFETKIERLKLYAKLSIFPQIFKSIKADFPEQDKVRVCQNIHTGKDFMGIWKDDKLVELFKKTCF